VVGNSAGNGVLSSMALRGRHRNDRSRPLGYAGCEVRQKRANAHAAYLLPILEDLKAAGTTSLTTIAAELTRRGIPTPAGTHRWRPVTVARLLRRLAQGDDAGE
jgi:hypothetical protein